MHTSRMAAACPLCSTCRVRQSAVCAGAPYDCMPATLKPSTSRHVFCKPVRLNLCVPPHATTAVYSVGATLTYSRLWVLLGTAVRGRGATARPSFAQQASLPA